MTKVLIGFIVLFTVLTVLGKGTEVINKTVLEEPQATVTVTPTLTLPNLAEFPATYQDGEIAYVQSKLYMRVEADNAWRLIKFFNN